MASFTQCAGSGNRGMARNSDRNVSTLDTCFFVSLSQNAPWLGTLFLNVAFIFTEQAWTAQEERLLEKAQQPPFCNYIRIHKVEPPPDEQAHAEWLCRLDANVVVAADGAASTCRRAFQHAFISPNTEGANIEAQQIRLGETTDDFEEADFALGIALKPDARPPQSQAMNVVLTLAQNVYLLNSQEGSRGFLNIRITKEEYDNVFEATNRRGCTFGTPIGLFKEEDLHLITDALTLIYYTGYFVISGSCSKIIYFRCGTVVLSNQTQTTCFPFVSIFFVHRVRG